MKLPQKNQPTWFSDPTTDWLHGVGSSYPSFAIWSIKSNTISHFLKVGNPEKKSWECGGVLFPGKNPVQGPPPPQQRKKLPVGIFWVEKIQLVPRRDFGGNEKSERIWSHDLSQSRVCIQSFCLQSDCLLTITPNIFQPGSIPIWLIRFRRMLRISQDWGLGEFCIILKDEVSWWDTLFRKSKIGLSSWCFAIGSSLLKGFFVVHDFISGGVYLNPSVETNGVPGVSSCQEDNTTNFEKNCRSSDLKGPFSPNKSSCCKNWGFFPKVDPPLWQKIASLICFASTLESWRNGFHSWKLIAPKQKDIHNIEKGTWEKTSTICLWKVSHPKGHVRHAACILHAPVCVGGYLTIEISTTTFLPNFSTMVSL